MTPLLLISYRPTNGVPRLLLSEVYMAEGGNVGYICFSLKLRAWQRRGAKVGAKCFKSAFTAFLRGLWQLVFIAKAAFA